MRFLALAVGLAATAVASGVLALLSVPAGRAAASEVSGPAPATAVLSPRRLPEAFASVVGEARLTAALDAALDDPSLAGAAACLSVESGDDLLYQRNPEASLVPASTLKVLTGMAALRRLGPEFRYVTPLVAPRGVPPGGVIEGEAWLVGSGDPLLSTGAYAASFRNQPQVFTPLDALADAVAAAGVREIRGGIVGDESRYDRIRYVPTWKPGYMSDNDVGPVSALSVNDGFTQFRPLARRHADDPALHAAATLSELLRARGVLVGEASSGTAPPTAETVAEVASPPLTEIVGELLRESDNMTAEMLVKELGKQAGAGGSWQAGLDVIRETLRDAGLSASGYRAVDGSGLDVSDRITCSLLMDALDLAGPSGAVAAGFAVAGESGTLAGRFEGTPAEGRLRAKTGSLNNVAGLAGFVDSTGGGTLEFALLANELPDRMDTGRRLQERIGTILSLYPQLPPIERLLPRGAAPAGEGRP